ncbi:hypothetical protein [Massilia endophytica]|uniref:hypothetical protein n=1 Tax=Massilia endophytica TaxID=2899220 RepID=UPI001E50BC05|nr:hypothetical protein [Massilia endophytica]UGQ47830.1 hypothetical protein LSQ66_04995 [Massilia endophytica]
MRNDNQQRADQPPIHTHLPDQVPQQDEKKIVGERVPHGADYNSPPPEGAAKSMGQGLDDVGGNLGEPAGGQVRSEGLLPADQEEKDGRFNVAEEVNLDQQSDSARRVGSLPETSAGPHGEKLGQAIAGAARKD